MPMTMLRCAAVASAATVLLLAPPAAVAQEVSPDPAQAPPEGSFSRPDYGGHGGGYGGNHAGDRDDHAGDRGEWPRHDSEFNGQWGENGDPRWAAKWAAKDPSGKKPPIPWAKGGALPDKLGGGLPGLYNLELIQRVADMPRPAQEAFLAVLGEKMRTQGFPASGKCNAFGGEGSCQTLPADSTFAASCPGRDLRVDCAYYDESMQEMDDDPNTELVEELLARGNLEPSTKCHSCFDNQHQLWCHQVVPKCGSFQSHVETSLLPALKGVIEATNAGMPSVQAVATVIPDLLRQSALSLPCRSMCEAVVATCGCGVNHTLGDLLRNYADDFAEQRDAYQLPANFARVAFSKIWDQPVCALYADEADPGFSGHCVKSSAPVEPCMWCNGNSAAPRFAEELMAASLAGGVFQWAGDALLDFMAEDDDEDEEGEEDLDLAEWEAEEYEYEEYEEEVAAGGGGNGKHSSKHSSGKGRKAGNGARMIGGILGLLLVGNGVAASIWFWRRRQQQNAQPPFAAYSAFESEDAEDMRPLGAM